MTASLISKGLMIVLSSPSGGGKSSLAQELLKTELNIRLSISATTRLPRFSEVEGKDYYFNTVLEFEQLIKQQRLLEYAKVYNHYYGTLLLPVEEALKEKIDVLFDIDWQGARTIKKYAPAHTVSIFILPPDIDTLRQRLEQRGEDSKDAIVLRLSKAYEEITYASEYDYVVINDHFEETVSKLKSIIIAEHSKTARLDKLGSYLCKK